MDAGRLKRKLHKLKLGVWCGLLGTSSKQEAALLCLERRWHILEEMWMKSLVGSDTVARGAGGLRGGAVTNSVTHTLPQMQNHQLTHVLMVVGRMGLWGGVGVD